MQKLFALSLAAALALAALGPAVSAQTAASFTGKWEGTLVQLRQDGTDGTPNPAAFDLKQNGKELTGTAGPPNQQINIEKGVVTAGTATFEAHPPNGATYTFTLTIVKGRLQGEMTVERDGQWRKGKIDAEKAK